jgi:hypothetical protein
MGRYLTITTVLNNRKQFKKLYLNSLNFLRVFGTFVRRTKSEGYRLKISTVLGCVLVIFNLQKMVLKTNV